VLTGRRHGRVSPAYVRRSADPRACARPASPACEASAHGPRCHDSASPSSSALAFEAMHPACTRSSRRSSTPSVTTWSRSVAKAAYPSAATPETQYWSGPEDDDRQASAQRATASRWLLHPRKAAASRSLVGSMRLGACGVGGRADSSLLLCLAARLEGRASEGSALMSGDGRRTAAGEEQSRCGIRYARRSSCPS